LRIWLRPRLRRAGLGPDTRRPGTKAWVIRIPGPFIGYGNVFETESFQTVVVAENEEMAWDIAVHCDVWERIPWKVDNVQIFPKLPLQQSDVSYTPCERG
jgi:hypothetical protein